MKNQDSLSITILDKEYRVSCPPEEQDSLQASANELNRKLSEIKRKCAVIGTERICATKCWPGNHCWSNMMSSIHVLSRCLKKLTATCAKFGYHKTTGHKCHDQRGTV